MLSKYITAVAALGLTTLASAQQPWQPCGIALPPCPNDQRCVPNSKDCTDLDWCRGTCQFKNKYTPCGGKRVDPVDCEYGFKCRDDPRLHESCGLACDIPGICIPTKNPQCAGYGGFACPKGLFCYDVPNDGCDPKHEGSDCLGLCL